MKEKPGWKTTEFWLTLVLTFAGVAGPVLAFYGIRQTEIDIWYRAITVLAPVVAAAWGISAYSKSRAEVKQAEIGYQINIANMQGDVGEIGDEATK